MTFQLRDYQSDMIERTRDALRAHQAVLLQSPTGSGKTAIGAFMLGSASSKGHRVTFIVHRQELIDQSSRAFNKAGISHGIIAAGFAPRPHERVQVASIDTLKRRLDRLPLPGLVVWDECHHVAAAGWSQVRAFYSSAKHVGLTATPYRLDGRGLGEHFGTIVRGPSVEWLIANGFLAKFRIFAPPGADASAVKVKMGDYVRRDLEGVMDRGGITGDAVRQYQIHASGKRAIAFCVSIAHSQHVCQAFVDAGFRAVHLDGETDRAQRMATMAKFRAGEVQVVCNVDLFGEGVDVPDVEAVIMLRPTQSLSLYLQQAGRACRPAEGKDAALILDHAGNVMRHGLPDDDREWSLEGVPGGKKGKAPDRGPPMKMCDKCFAVHRPAPVCPECGHRYEMELPEIREGDLVELDVDAMRAKRKSEEKNARSFAELLTIAIGRGYRNPENWATHVLEGRKAAAQKYRDGAREYRQRGVA